MLPLRGHPIRGLQSTSCVDATPCGGLPLQALWSGRRGSSTNARGASDATDCPQSGVSGQA
eukprot:6450654-Alexandrium_andersonii.AAC.1